MAAPHLHECHTCALARRADLRRRAPAAKPGLCSRRVPSPLCAPSRAVAGKAANGSACPGTQPPKFSLAEVNATLFGAAATPAGPTVATTFDRCSGGRSRFTPATSRLASVSLPCSGVTNGVAWDFATCDFDDFNGWADAADEALAASGVDLAQYRYR